MSDAFVVGFIAHRAKWLHVWIFCGIAIAGDIYAIIDPLVEIGERFYTKYGYNILCVLRFS